MTFLLPDCVPTMNGVVELGSTNLVSFLKILKYLLRLFVGFVVVMVATVANCHRCRCY